jgi:hypothetical protein
MRFSEIIAESNLIELGDKPYSYDIVPPRPGLSDFATYAADNGKIKVLFSNWYSEDNSSGELIANTDIQFRVYGEIHITGGGDQYKIFSTVAQIIKKELPKLIHQYSLGSHIITFQAAVEDISRINLYDNRVVKFFNQLLGPDWQFSKTSDTEYINYVWSRIK